MRRYLVEALGHDSAPYEHLDWWDFWIEWGWDVEHFVAKCHEAVDSGFFLATGKPHDGTCAALSSLLNAGHEVHIVTARNFGTLPGASEAATRQWLEEYQIPFTSLTISDDKTVVPTDMFVEDYLPNYDKLTAAGTTAFLINRAWNAPYDDGRNRVASTTEFASVVLSLELTAGRGSKQDGAGEEAQCTGVVPGWTAPHAIRCLLSA